MIRLRLWSGDPAEHRCEAATGLGVRVHHFGEHLTLGNAFPRGLTNRVERQLSDCRSLAKESDLFVAFHPTGFAEHDRCADEPGTRESGFQHLNGLPIY